MPSGPRSSMTRPSTALPARGNRTRSPTLNFGGLAPSSRLFLLLFLAIGPPPYGDGPCRLRVIGNARAQLRLSNVRRVIQDSLRQPQRRLQAVVYLPHEGVGQVTDDAPHVRLRDRMQPLAPD